MICRVEAGKRQELEAKALRYRPRSAAVPEDVIEVIRLVLLAGVRAHGDGGVVRGVASGRDLTTAGGVLVRFLPSVCALGASLATLKRVLVVTLFVGGRHPEGAATRGGQPRQSGADVGAFLGF